MGNHLAYDIKAQLLPSIPSRGRGSYFPLSGDRYCFSATLFHQLYLLPASRWTKSMERAYQESLPLVMQFVKQYKGSGMPHPLIEETGPAFWDDFFDFFYKLRMGRLCAALRTKTPDAYAGYSILIFKVTDDEVRKAILDPPVEMMPDPDFMKGNSMQRIHSPSARFHCSKGLVFVQKGKYDEAIKEFQKSLTFEPDAADVKEILDVLLQQKDK
jgi:tetratricopeptide (TPR) repeat protein